MSNLELFASSELLAAGLFDKESDYGGMVGEAVMELIRVFAAQGHSGFSAGMVSSLFDKLSRFQPITPLTGNDDEWIEIVDGTFQNRRCSHVFKENGVAYDIDGRVFRAPSGACYTNSDSRVTVTFPYTPVRTYVDVPE